MSIPQIRRNMYNRPDYVAKNLYKHVYVHINHIL